MANIHDLQLAADAVKQFQRQSQELTDVFREARRVVEFPEAVKAAVIEHRRMMEDARRVLENQVALSRPPELPLGIADAMARVSELFAGKEAINLLTDGVQRMRADWEAIKLTPEAIANHMNLPTFTLRVPETLGIAALTDAKLAMLRFDNIGRAIGVDQSVQKLLVDDATELTRTFTELYRCTALPRMEAVPAVGAVTRLPTVEVFNNTDLLGLISSDDGSGRGDDDMHVRDEIEEDTSDAMRRYLRSLDPELVVLADGADAVFGQKGPDWVRHCTTSLRELFTQVLHRLAPDDEMRTWSTSAQDFANGRPTRNARLRYICRNVNAGPFEKFIEADMKAVGEFIQLFQQGTHGVGVPFSDVQVRAMKARMEGLVRLLLEIGLHE